MLRKILVFGLIAGLLAGIPISAITVTMHTHSPRYGMAIGYTIMLIALSTVFVAVKRYRDIELGGVIGFWRAFGLGIGISAVAGVVYVAAWETTVTLAHLDFATGYAKMMIAQQKAAGVSGAALEKFTADMEQFKANYANPLYRLPMVFVEIFPVGLLVSLVTAGLLCFRSFLPARRS